ncbi:MAG: hypothetical protein HY360_25260 [Verrucomicrobia bacterium]|nr:hypothetical protein [Verrucomicrobiota bacterium]
MKHVLTVLTLILALGMAPMIDAGESSCGGCDKTKCDKKPASCCPQKTKPTAQCSARNARDCVRNSVRETNREIGRSRDTTTIVYSARGGAVRSGTVSVTP